MAKGNSEAEMAEVLERENMMVTSAAELGTSCSHASGDSVREISVFGVPLPSQVTVIYGVAGAGKTSVLRSIVSGLPDKVSALVVTDHMEEWDDVGGDCAISFYPLTVRGKCSATYTVRSRADVIIVDEPRNDAYEWVKVALDSGFNLILTLQSESEEYARRTLGRGY